MATPICKRIYNITKEAVARTVNNKISYNKRTSANTSSSATPDSPPIPNAEGRDSYSFASTHGLIPSLAKTEFGSANKGSIGSTAAG
jgi:hypothetical protein